MFYMKQSDILRCPHCIIVPEHYREDGTCYCNDPTATIMLEWGYVLDVQNKVWANPDEVWLT